jgi:hypothetical protein
MRRRTGLLAGCAAGVVGDDGVPVHGRPGEGRHEDRRCQVRCGDAARSEADREVFGPGDGAHSESQQFARFVDGDGRFEWSHAR